ncbi:hypothetical protein HSX37_15035|uniref:DUF5666 domain-containing protein n=1 Tax=Dendrosporobacter quercicolus TaxID=146817 RepID=A0A1G9RTJ9_9FIRM|nr:hypothetical protein [Dendrosporobacter quercicolus]NSL49349.1 hypothetical protein [Dendrosporobacter quercicolus DSM 1736]SDM26608.1 hypothetical protein SAMN04488502_103100 [Dendrosporobacter quercicolus]
MQRIVVIIFVLVLSAAVANGAAAEDAPPAAQGEVVSGNAYIPKGTVLRAELMDTLDSKTCSAGDKFSFKILHHVIIAGNLVIAKGTVGEGVIKSVKKAGLFGKGGRIELEATSIKTRNGIEVPVILRKKSDGGGHKADLDWYDDASSATPALTIGVMSGIAAGSDIRLGAGEKLTVTVPFRVDLQATLQELPGRLHHAVAEEEAGSDKTDRNSAEVTAMNTE